MRNLETKEQSAVITWAAYALGKYPALKWLHCSLNGAHLTPTQAKIAKAQGMKAGISDLFLPVKSGPYAGLYIEMKIKPNTPTIEQKAFIEFVKTQHYYAKVCYSWYEAKELIVNYLEGTIQDKK